jgi:hypothetical protein
MTGRGAAQRKHPSMLIRKISLGTEKRVPNMKAAMSTRMKTETALPVSGPRDLWKSFTIHLT